MSQTCQAKLSSSDRPSFLCPSLCLQIHKDNAKKLLCLFLESVVLRKNAALESMLGYVQ